MMTKPGSGRRWRPAVEQGPDGRWYAVVKVNHLTKFTVFSTAVPEPVQPPKVIKLTIGSTEAIINGEPYTLDAAPFIKPKVSRTLVPLRFVSEALGARVELAGGYPAGGYPRRCNRDHPDHWFSRGAGQQRAGGPGLPGGTATARSDLRTAALCERGPGGAGGLGCRHRNDYHHQVD
jgi:hypothetical protein